MKKKWMCLALVLSLLMALTGCSGGTAVYVQSVKRLVSLGGIAPGDRFAGMVVSENVTEIKRDADKTIKELLVREGDDVKTGQVLFSYDTEALQLNLDKQRLELEQLKGTAESHEAKIVTLERGVNRSTGTTKLEYTLELQTAQIDLKETQIKIKAKETEIKKAEELLENAEVTSPIDGRIQNIQEGDSQQNGESGAYITIQKIGSYRIKGIIGELQRGGIQEGDQVIILSRTEESVSWQGTVTLVDYENPSQGSDQDRYYGNSVDTMTASSKYPFYVELDSTDGLILGQHVYMELKQDEGEAPGIGISSAFVCYREDGTAYVWAEKKGKLEERDVILGEYNPMNDTQQITAGLTEDDYIAFPDSELCREGAPTTREAPKEEQAPEGEVA